MYKWVGEVEGQRHDAAPERGEGWGERTGSDDQYGNINEGGISIKG